MDEIAAIVTEVLKENDFMITGAAYQNLVVHLYIAISRIMEGHYVPMPEGLLDNPEERNPGIIRSLVESGADIQFVGELRHSMEDIYLEMIQS